MTPTEPCCYLNGDYLPLEGARVSVLDRGFLFGDGVYEVVPAYHGRIFRLDEHLDRLHASLAAIRLDSPLTRPGWRGVLEALIRRNGGGDLSLYLQVTRGPGPGRDHAFPPAPLPTVFAMASRQSPPDPEWLRAGIAAVTVPDIRWQRCDIKAVTLLANVLLRQQALDAGAQEALLIRDGELTEGSASNVFIVRDGRLATPPKGPLLLPGITRDLVVELALRDGMACEERPVRADELFTADEVWTTSSTREVMAVTRIDGRIVGDGRPGAMWRRMRQLYDEFKASLADASGGKR